MGARRLQTVEAGQWDPAGQANRKRDGNTRELTAGQDRRGGVRDKERKIF